MPASPGCAAGAPASFASVGMPPIQRHQFALLRFVDRLYAWQRRRVCCNPARQMLSCGGNSFEFGAAWMLATSVESAD